MSETENNNLKARGTEAREENETGMSAVKRLASEVLQLQLRDAAKTWERCNMSGMVAQAAEGAALGAVSTVLPMVTVESVQPVKETAAAALGAAMGAGALGGSVAAGRYESNKQAVNSAVEQIKEHPVRSAIELLTVPPLFAYEAATRNK